MQVATRGSTNRLPAQKLLPELPLTEKSAGGIQVLRSNQSSPASNRFKKAQAIRQTPPGLGALRPALVLAVALDLPDFIFPPIVLGSPLQVWQACPIQEYQHTHCHPLRNNPATALWPALAAAKESGGPPTN